MATARLQDRLNRWEILNANLKQHLEAMPDLTAKQGDFEAIIAQDVALAAQYNQLIGTARSIILERRALAKKGNQIRNIFVAALRHSFGPESQQLNEFGVRPRVRRKKPAPGSQPESAGRTTPAPVGSSSRPSA